MKGPHGRRHGSGASAERKAVVDKGGGVDRGGNAERNAGGVVRRRREVKAVGAEPLRVGAVQHRGVVAKPAAVDVLDRGQRVVEKRPAVGHVGVDDVRLHPGPQPERGVEPVGDIPKPGGEKEDEKGGKGRV